MTADQATAGRSVRLVVERWERDGVARIFEDRADTMTQEPTTDVPDDEFVDPMRDVYPQAQWVQSGEVHYLTVDESVAGAQDRTVYRIEPARLAGDTSGQNELGDAGRAAPAVVASLTVIRSGSVEWHHRFVAGESASSLLRVRGAGDIPVVTATAHLDVTLGEATGSVLLWYTLAMGDVTQHVEIQLAYN